MQINTAFSLTRSSCKRLNKLASYIKYTKMTAVVQTIMMETNTETVDFIHIYATTINLKRKTMAA